MRTITDSLHFSRMGDRSITLRESDMSRILSSLEDESDSRRDDKVYSWLLDRLADAQVLAEQKAPMDLVSLGAIVRVREIFGTAEYVFLLTLQKEDLPRHVSVFSPLGAAVLGRRRWELVTPVGASRDRAVQIVTVFASDLVGNPSETV